MDWLITLVSMFVAVATGVVANIATFFFTSVCLPAYRDYVYKEIRVDGDWTITHNAAPEDGKALTISWELSANLNQRANFISGTAVARHNNSPSGRGDIINYAIDGHVKDGILSLRLCNTDPSRVAHSTFLIKVAGDASTLKGYRLFYGLRMNEIRAVKCTWSRGVHGLHYTSSKPHKPLGGDFKVPKNGKPQRGNKSPSQVKKGFNKG